MIRFVRISLLSLVLVIAAAFVSVGAIGGHCHPYVPPAHRVDQGCVNQGNDRRIAAPVVCGLQRELSWKSDDPPRLFRVGNRRLTHLEIAWPPYLVVNSPDGDGHWRMFRIGIRYDRNWRGYIFPTAACKCMEHPLLY